MPRLKEKNTRDTNLSAMHIGCSIRRPLPQGQKCPSHEHGPADYNHSEANLQVDRVGRREIGSIFQTNYSDDDQDHCGAYEEVILDNEEPLEFVIQFWVASSASMHVGQMLHRWFWKGESRAELTLHVISQDRPGAEVKVRC
jgi:hypothetical protein